MDEKAKWASALEIEAMTVVVPPGRAIVDQVAARVGPGRLAAVIGPNGAGKSTLLKSILGLVKTRPPSKALYGEIDLGSLKRKSLAALVSYLPQSSQPVQSSVYDAVLLGRRPHVSWRPGREDHRLCREAIEELGLGLLQDRGVGEISGGEFQKVLIARALVQGTPILLLDEPINHLDIKNQIETMDLVSSLTRRRGLITLIVLHDLSLALRYADDILLLSQGRALYFGSKEGLPAERLSDAYRMRIAIEAVHGIPRALY